MLEADNPLTRHFTQSTTNLSLPTVTPNGRSSIEDIIGIIFVLDSQQPRVIDTIESLLPIRLVRIPLKTPSISPQYPVFYARGPTHLI
jgi:hypothetical protein